MVYSWPYSKPMQIRVLLSVNRLKQPILLRMQDAFQREVGEGGPKVVFDILHNGKVALDRTGPWEDRGQSATEVPQHRKATTSVRPAVLEPRRLIATLETLLERLLGSKSKIELFKLLLNHVNLGSRPASLEAVVMSANDDSEIPAS